MRKIPKDAITEAQLRKEIIRVSEEGYSSRGDWAKSHDITAQSVSAFMNKSQGAGLKIPAALGYEPVTIYVPLRKK